MNREELKKIIPHREPMLLVDEASLEDDMAIGKYTVKGDEYFLKGHFPDKPVVPGVILCEMMAQAGCVLLKDTPENFTPFFASLNNVRFKTPVVPGDTIIFKCKTTRQKGPFYFISGQGHVGDKLCVSGDFSFAVVTGE